MSVVAQLHWAAEIGDIRDEYDTPLFNAARYNRIAAGKVLLEAGAVPDAKTTSRRPPVSPTFFGSVSATSASFHPHWVQPFVSVQCKMKW